MYIIIKSNDLYGFAIRDSEPVSTFHWHHNYNYICVEVDTYFMLQPVQHRRRNRSSWSGHGTGVSKINGVVAFYGSRVLLQPSLAAAMCTAPCRRPHGSLPVPPFQLTRQSFWETAFSPNPMRIMWYAWKGQNLRMAKQEFEHMLQLGIICPSSTQNS